MANPESAAEDTAEPGHYGRDLVHILQAMRGQPDDYWCHSLSTIEFISYQWRDVQRQAPRFTEEGC